MHYFALVMKQPDERLHGLIVPDCPGVTAVGTTLDEVVRNGAQALRLWAEAEQSAERPVPETRALEDIIADEAVQADIGAGAVPVLLPLLVDAGRSVKLTISMNAGLLELIKSEADARGVTRSAFLAGAARDKIMA